MSASPPNAQHAEQLAAAGRWEEAGPLFDSLLLREPNNVRYVVGAGLAASHTARTREAIDHLKLAAKLSPNDWRIHHALGGQHYLAAEFDVAVKCFRRAIELDPKPPEPQAGLGCCLAIMGDLKSAWPLLRYRTAVSPLPVDFIPRWNGEPLAGKTIFLHNDQGFGDAINFIRYVPLLTAAGARVLVATPAHLRTLLATMEGVARIVPHNVPPEPCDFRCTLMDLPSFFSNSFETVPNTVPYLHTDPQRVEAAAKAFLPRVKPRIGLVWSGNPKHPNTRLRDCAPQHLRVLEEVESVEFVSLQWRHGNESETPFDMPDLTGAIKDFANAAAVISQLDLLITVDTAFAHIAGAIAAPVWLMLPLALDWRWGARGESTPWYPTMRLFRQTELAGWEPVVQRVKDALAKEFP